MNRKNTIAHFRFKIFLAALALVILIILTIYIGTLIYQNNQDSKIQKVLGIDVSAHQGEINWPEVEKQGIYFAYIKATESTDYKDSQFDKNWRNINKTNIKKGAYLFYDFGKDGNLMADFFIKTVPVENHTLPPAIDIEIDNNHPIDANQKNTIINNVKKIVTKLKDNYQQNPVIYTNMNTYNTYFKGTTIEDTKYWICDINNSSPELKKDEWLFWQFSWRGMLNGMNSDEIFVDYDIYNGNLKDFNNGFNSNFITRMFN